jgi:hypothetical protein
MITPHFIDAAFPSCRAGPVPPDAGSGHPHSNMMSPPESDGGSELKLASTAEEGVSAGSLLRYWGRPQDRTTASSGRKCVR